MDSDKGSSRWLDRPEWQNGQIHSNAGSAWKTLAVVALIWNLFTFSMTAAFFLDRPPRFPDAAYLILLFPAVGLLLAWMALKAYRQWRRHGLLNLTLDPYPGSIGGEVGGWLTVPVGPRELDDLEVVLSCVRVSISRSSKSSSRHESVAWRRQANTRVEAAANGARIQFLTRVDSGLPDAEAPSNRYHQWMLWVRSKRAGLDRQFELPVFDQGDPLTSRLPIDPEPPVVERSDLPAEMVRVSRRGDGLELIYPSSRSGPLGMVFGLFGLVFAGAGAFLVVQALSSGSLFANAILGLMALLFSAIGWAIVALGVYLKFNELRVLLGPERIITRRQVGPWKRLQSAPTAEIDQVDKTIGMQSGQGAAATLYYRLQARHGDRKLLLGDGIKGQPAADALLGLIRAELARDELGRGRDGQGDPADRADHGRDPADETRQGLASLDPAQAAAIARWLKTAKWVFNAFALVLVALFLIEFFDLWSD